MARELPLRSKSMWKWTKRYDLVLNHLVLNHLVLNHLVLNHLVLNHLVLNDLVQNDLALNRLVVEINPVPASGGPSSLAQTSDDLAT